VALKILPLEYASDSQRRSRLLREARIASLLNHPNIVSIHEVGSDNGMDFIAMELVAGKSLAKMIPGGKGLPPAKVLDYAAQIAAGLARAHADGVVHRDLKPANVMLTSDGLVKLLDFSLAQHVELGNASHTTLTIEGEIVGTPSYMSPEQARGLQVDARSDIFSFGCVLYEMLSGRRPFGRPTSVESMAAVVKEDPPPLPDTIAPGIAAIVAHCLEKEPGNRFQSAQDLAFALRSANPIPLASGPSPAPSKHRRRNILFACSLLTVSLGCVLLGAWLFESPAIDVTRHRYSPIVATAETRAISEGGGAGAHAPAWSPDGRSIAYSGAGIRLQRVDSFESVRLTAAGIHPFFSADGSRIYYLVAGQTQRELWSVSIAGGTPERVLSDLGGSHLLAGAAASPDGKALVVVHSHQPGDDLLSVWISSPPGAPPRPYPASPAGRNLSRAHLRFSPDGSTLLLILSPTGHPAEWWLLPWPPPAEARPSRVRHLFKDGAMGTWATSADWLPDNRHLIASILQEGDHGGPLWVADTVTETRRPITVGPLAFTQPRVSREGRVIFHMPKAEEHAIEIPLDGSAIRPLLAGFRREQYPSWSPVAEHLLFVTDQRGEPEIWLNSPREGRQWPVVTQRDFLPESGRRQFVSPVFSPDGTRIAYGSNGAIWVSPIVGGPPLRIGDGYCATWSPDGAWLAFINGVRASPMVLMKVKVGRAPEVVPIRNSVGRALPRWSPDGKWITVQLAEGFGLVSPDGTQTRILYKGKLDMGSACGWSRDGATLFLAYLSASGRALSAFATATGAERRTRDLGPMHFSYFAAHSAGLSLSPDGKSLAGSTLNLRFEPWILDGLEPPRPFWTRLFRK
jgi:eukaryotic-like serine/threonine-protein kinase